MKPHPVSMIGAVLLLVLIGCDGDARPGTAVYSSVESEARSSHIRKEADAAALAAIRLEAEADALNEKATATPSSDTIARAASARADALFARRLSVEMERLAADASATASAKAKEAAIERAAELADADRRWWIGITRCVGLAGVLLGLLIGGALARYASPREGAFWGILIAGAGILAAGYGATLSWLPVVAITLVSLLTVAGMLVWWRRHGATAGVAIAASRTIDAMEVEPIPDASETVAQAKLALGRAVDRSGMRRRLDSLRGATRRWIQ